MLSYTTLTEQRFKIKSNNILNKNDKIKMK